MMDADTDGNQTNHGGDSPPGVRRACDQCRLRKIRCDKESPCSNCRSARRTCSSLGLGQKPKEPRQRVLISTQYEKKIDFMGDRLAVIEDLIRNLPLGGTAGPSSSSQPRNHLRPGRSSTGSPYDESSEWGGGRRPSTSGPEEEGGAADDHDDGDDDHDGAASSVLNDPEAAETFEGPSSFAAHAAFASDFAATAASAAVTPFSGPDARMDSALSSLRQMVNLLRSSRGGGGGDDGAPAAATPESQHPPQHAHYRGRLRDLPMPPVDRVTSRLRGLKSAPGPGLLVVVTCFADMDRFLDRCRRVYLHTSRGDIPPALFLIVNAGLVHLFFEEAINAPPGPEKEELLGYTARCRANVEAAVAQLPLLLPASLENLEALLMAASAAIDVSRPSLAWLLTSRAAHMCRVLGLHQAPPPGPPRSDDDGTTARTRALLFWSTYMLDKGLSLRLGRASVLQDYDISVPRMIDVPAPTGAKAAASSSSPGLVNQAVLGLWIKHAEIQGRIYQRLYSPGALRQPDAARARQVDLIVADLQILRRETARLRADVLASSATPSSSASASAAAAAGAGATADGDHQNRLFALILQTDEVSYLSSLALAYRAVPPAPGVSGHGSRSFAVECLDAARAAMRCHTDFMESLGDTGLKIVYLHWTILYAPFIPFIVIFCHVIETAGSQAFSASVFPATTTAVAVPSNSVSPDGGDSVPTRMTTTSPLQAEIQADLRLLDLFIRSLEDGRASSAALAQLHRLSLVLRNVAALYVEAKTASAAQAAQASVSTSAIFGSSQHHHQQPYPDAAAGPFLDPVGDEFDLYLSQLGFMPLDEDAAMDGAATTAPAALPQQGDPVFGGDLDEGGGDVDMLRNVQLGDWFSGNNHILGLVEEDLSGFNAPGW